MAWSRADKINFWIAVAAFATAAVTAVPVSMNLLDRWQRPQAFIDHPTDGTQVQSVTLAVDGHSQRIPKDADLWLVIRSDGRWYPAGKCRLSRDGTWSFPADAVHLGGPEEAGIFVMSVYLAQPSQTGEFANYLDNQEKGADSGMASLPDGIALMHSISVTRVH
jgi:hypothetical protein